MRARDQGGRNLGKEGALSDMDHFASSELMRAMDSMMPVAKSDGRTQGKVTKVEPDGTVWVALRDSRGIVEMPCKRSVVAAKPGDTVAVTVRERRAIVESNISSPAATVEQTSELVKSSAQELSDNTNQLFQSAISDAQAAHEAAGRAEADAQSAADSAASAATSAASAATSAENAERDAERSAVAAELSERKALESNGYALGALNSLATLQDVMGTIGWAADNAAFVEASGEYDQNGRYFVKGGYWLPKTLTQEQYEDGTWYVKGEDGTYSEATGDYDADAAYYTWVAGTFTDTQDPPNLYAVVPESSKADFDAGSYYVMDMRQSMAEYVSKHVVFAYGTLWITPDGVTGEGIAGEGDDPAGRIAIGTEGITLYDGHGRRIARYGSGVDLGAAGDGTQTSIASDVLALLREAVIDGEPGTYPVFQVGTEAGENPFLQFADGKGHDLFTVDSTGKPTFAKPVPIPSGGTDATNEGDAADNLMVQSIGAGMEIPADTDLNTLTTPGNYVCGFTSNVAGFANKPTPLTNAFRLTVFKVLGNTEHSANEGHRGQLIMDWTSGREYYRVYNGSSKNWGSWRTKRQDTDVIDVLHGGHGGTTVIQARDNLKLNSIRYTTTASSAGYIKVKINSKTSWMLAFDVSLYQSYKNYVIRISGYNYSTTGTWHAPAATMVSASENEAVTVYFGHDSVNDLWVAFPAGQYTGVEISAVTNGYTNVLSTFALQDLFTITRVTSLSGTTDKTVAVRRPVYRGEALAISEYGTGANTAAGAYKNITGQTKDFDTNNTADIWVPVFASGKVQHREIPAWFNSVYWNDFWQSLTSVASSGQSVHVVRRCNVVTIRGDNILIATSSDKADMPICNIPAGYRPPCTVDCIANNGQLWLASNGNLTVAGSNRDGRRVYFNVTYTIA